MSNNNQRKGNKIRRNKRKRQTEWPEYYEEARAMRIRNKK